MSVKDSLTNEKLVISGRFDNAFTLVNYAIAFAKNRMRKGQATDKNMACEILDEIVDNKDILELVIEEDDEDDEIVSKEELEIISAK